MQLILIILAICLGLYLFESLLPLLLLLLYLYLLFNNFIRVFPLTVVYFVYQSNRNSSKSNKNITETRREKYKNRETYANRINSKILDLKQGEKVYAEGNKGIEYYCLGLSQILKDHPVLREKKGFKECYINALEHFVQKYSSDNIWSFKVLDLYKNNILENLDDYNYGDFYNCKCVWSNKFRFFEIYTFRYILVVDVLFVVSLYDKNKVDNILKEFSLIYNKSSMEKVIQLIDYMYGFNDMNPNLKYTESLLKGWVENKKFLYEKPKKILLSANMSAGKSTLVNALIGKKISKTKNDACTAKLHIIKNKPFEDNFTYELDYDLNLNADCDVLMDDNEQNKTKEIYVGTFFRTVGNEYKNVCLIDSPGVNSYFNDNHKINTN